MFTKVAVIGLGTLGGFLAKHISEIDSIKELVIVDYDIVESRNVFTSIYSPFHVGEYKVDALESFLNDDVTVTKINRRYTEGKTSLPMCDLIIDCRDIVCDRTSEIDVRFFITGKVLVVDCRKTVKNECEYEGAYSIPLTKSEIYRAAFYAAQLIDSEQMNHMLKNKLVQRIDLDILPSLMDKAIKQTLENKMDLIYENPDISRRLQCIEDSIKPLMELNKSQDIEVYVGERPETNIIKSLFHKIPDVAENKYSMIPANSITSSMDIMTKLSEIVRRQPGVSNFIVTIRKKHGKPYVELLEETGAA